MTTEEFPSASTLAIRKNESFNRYALLTLASLYTFFFVGAPFGWGPMQRLLESAGAFAYLCDADADADSCAGQSQTLINIGFMTSTLSVVTPLLGTAIDRFKIILMKLP